MMRLFQSDHFFHTKATSASLSGVENGAPKPGGKTTPKSRLSRLFYVWSHVQTRSKSRASLQN